MGPQLKEAELRGRRIQDIILSPWLWIAGAALAGLFLGSLSIGPANQRYIKLGLGLILGYLVLRFPVYISAGIFIIVYTLPTVLWLGNTNILFLLCLTIVWVIKYGLRIEASPKKTFLDWAIFLYILAHLVSVFQMRTGDLDNTVRSLLHLLSPLLLFYIVVNAARTTKRLELLAQAFTFSMAFVYFTAIMERFFHSITYIPSWYLWGQGSIYGEAQVFRAMGIFRTHGLLSDACALCLILQIFLVAYYRRNRFLASYHVVIGIVSMSILMLTGNRGGLLALAFGLVYMLWIFNKGIKVRHLVTGALIIGGIILISEWILSAQEGNITLISRLIATEFNENYIPDTRKDGWPAIWELIMQKPIAGHGPYYDLLYYRSIDNHMGWPHNAFLFYFVTIGLFGVLIYIILLTILIFKTFPGRGHSMAQASLAKGLAIVFHVNVIQLTIGELRTDHQRPDVRVIFMWVIYSLAVLAYYLWREERQSKSPVNLPAK